MVCRQTKSECKEDHKHRHGCRLTNRLGLALNFVLCPHVSTCAACVSASKHACVVQVEAFVGRSSIKRVVLGHQHSLFLDSGVLLLLS